MPNVAQRSFAKGEIAPALYARTDVAAYTTGLRTCRNFIVQRTGGVHQRPGTDFVNEVKNSGSPVRLIKFVFNNDQAFVLEFGDRYFRVYANGAYTGVEVTTPFAGADIGGLRYVQSADVMTIVHPLYPPQHLERISNTDWKIGTVFFGPLIFPPDNLVVTGGNTVTATVYLWLVTSISATTGEESEGSLVVFQVCDLSTQSQTLTWDHVQGAGSYNVYRAQGGGGVGGFGFIGATIDTATPSFVDSGATIPDFSHGPPNPFTGFTSPNNYPSITGFYQQRQLYANTINEPGKVWCSQTGNYQNFGTRVPLQEDDAVIFALANSEVVDVRHLLDLGKLILGTEGGEWLIEGDANGILTPFAINPRVGSYNGSSDIQPVKVDNSILYIQALGNKVLELKTNILYGYYTFTGKDLTIYSTHLFDGFTINEWDYAQIPNYLTWAVRSDGVLLGFTYVAGEELAAWHRHDTDGFFEDVCVIPEGGEHRVYVVVNRGPEGAAPVNNLPPGKGGFFGLGGIVVSSSGSGSGSGGPRRFIERLRPLTLLDIADACYMDSALEYDGRNAGVASNPAVTMTLTNATGWGPNDPLTLTASGLGVEFTAQQIGDARFLRDTTGDQIVATIAAFINSSSVTVYANTDVPKFLQNTPTLDWDRAVKTIGGLDHLEGKSIAVFADKFVVASPNNPTVTPVFVSGGIAVLDQAYAHIVAGLPYVADLETMDIDTPQGPSLKESNLMVTAVGLWLESSRGAWMGAEPPAGDDPTEGLDELKIRENEDPSQPVDLVTDYERTDIPSEWSKGGRVFIRQIDPVPLNVLAIIPLGYLP